MSRINGVLAMKLLDDFRLAKVEPLLFGAGRLCVSEYRPYVPDDELMTYDSWWMYPTLRGALHALRTWDGHGDPPAGWTKCDVVPEKIAEAAAQRVAEVFGSPARAATLPRR